MPFFGGITIISVMKTQEKNALPAFGLSLERGQILKNLQHRLQPRLQATVGAIWTDPALSW